MSDAAAQIKSRLDIVEVVSGYLKLQKAGANYKARCPFHNEKTPSFHISPERQSWHCFGCNKGGDLFSFVQEIEGIDFVEALRMLAAKAGVELPQWRPDQAREKDQRGPLLAIADLSAQFFTKQLWHSNAGAKALAYLRGRGLKDETIVAWRLGWAPNDWQALTSFLMERGYTSSHIVGAGMAIDRSGRPHDRFRSRIMFPIADANGHVVGFSGRVFGAQVTVDGQEPAKYINTPQTLIYDKSRILFGLDKAKLDIRRRDQVLLVEGNMDAIMAWQAGATQTIATSGTALTPHQLKMLSRYSMHASFCFDADQAGQIATRRGIGLALGQQFTVKVLTLGDPECKDPADYVAKHGERFTTLVDTAKPVLEYYYDRAVAGYDPHSAEQKKGILVSMGPFIKRLTSAVERSHWMSQLASLLRTDVKNIQADLATLHDDLAVTDRPVPEEQEVKMAVPPRPLDPLSQELLALAMKDQSLLSQAAAVPAELIDRRVATVLADPMLLQPGGNHEYTELIDIAAIRAAELWQGWSPQDLKAELATLINRLKERSIRRHLTELSLDVQQAETQHDRARLEQLLEQFNHYSQELHRLHEKAPETLS